MARRAVMLVVILTLLAGGAGADVPFERRATLHSGFDAEAGLSEEEITLLLRAAFSMPTGGDQRALEFFVVTDRGTLRAMKGGNPYSQALDSAPCVIVIAANTEEAWYDELLEMDAGLAAGAILLQAADLGLASCVLSIAPQQERIRSVRKALGMGDQLLPILMTAVGLPAADAVTGASVDNWSDQRVHRDGAGFHQPD